MVGTKPSHMDDASYLRKIRKPMVEKQRRERMNHSISQLKLLIASTIKQQVAPMTKVDKADILELTVYHLAQLQQQERSVTMATEAAAYNTGFKDCAREAVTHLSSTRLTSESTVSLLNNHLYGTFMMKSRQRHHSGNHGVTLSTPARQPEPMNVSTQELPAPMCSPILPNDSSYFNTSHGSVDNLSYSVSDSESSSLSLSVSMDTNSSTSDIHNSVSDVTSSSLVTIGKGKENEIGHVITESVWRPW